MPSFGVWLKILMLGNEAQAFLHVQLRNICREEVRSTRSTSTWVFLYASAG